MPPIVAMYNRQSTSVVVVFPNMPTGMIFDLRDALKPSKTDSDPQSREYQLDRIHVHERDDKSHFYMPRGTLEDEDIKRLIQTWVKEELKLDVNFIDTTKPVRR